MKILHWHMEKCPSYRAVRLMVGLLIGFSMRKRPIFWLEQLACSLSGNMKMSVLERCASYAPVKLFCPHNLISTNFLQKCSTNVMERRSSGKSVLTKRYFIGRMIENDRSDICMPAEKVSQI